MESVKIDYRGFGNGTQGGEGVKVHEMVSATQEEIIKGLKMFLIRNIM